jgi:hypothetical protein
VTHRRFNLVRDEDVTGLSGTGVVAEGVVFTDGVVSLRWTGKRPTSVVWHDGGIASVDAIHGHNGKTRIVWLDGGPWTIGLSSSDVLTVVRALRAVDAEGLADDIERGARLVDTEAV